MFNLPGKILGTLLCAEHISINIDETLLQGCCRNAKIFKKYYEKEIVNFVDDEEDIFQQSLLM